jgi:PAS domain S-box-containing protein
LQAERERLSVTLASIGDGVITTDAAGRVSFMNGVAQALTGWELAEAAGRPLEEVYSLIREAEGEPAEALAVKARRADGAGPARPGLLVAKDGRPVPVEDKVAPIRDNQGLLIGSVLSLRDIRERRQAEAAVRQSRDEISAILQGAAEGITAQDRSGRLRYANDAAARLLGFPSAQALLEAPPDEVTQKVVMFDEDGRPFPAEALPGRVALQGAPAPSAVIRYRILATGEEYWSAVKATPVFDAQGRVELVVSLFQNITYLKEAELHQRLLADVGKLLAGPLDPTALLAELARVAVPALADWCAVDVRGEEGIIERVAVAHGDPVNAEMAVEPPERFPLDPAAPQGVPKVLRSGVSEFYPVLTAEMIQGVTRDPEQLEFLRGLNPKSMMIVPLNARGRTLGAQTFVSTVEGRHYRRVHLELAEEMARRAALALENANLYADAQRLNAELENTVSRRTAQLQASNARLRDEVAERQEAQRRLEESQAQLRRLSAHLQAGREEERTRIAREIHDELGQNLAGLKMGLAWLQKGMPGKDSAARAKLKDMANLVEGTVATVRRIVTELRPRILDELGLAAAIEWQLTEFQQRTGLECVLRSNVAELNLEAERATAVFRLLQEALTNTARHAQATRVLVAIEQGRDELRFRVEDNGRGISEADLANSKSFGLLGMRERVNILQGELSIQGVPGQGTVIEIHFPISRNSE